VTSHHDDKRLFTTSTLADKVDHTDTGKMVIVAIRVGGVYESEIHAVPLRRPTSLLDGG